MNISVRSLYHMILENVCVMCVCVRVCVCACVRVRVRVCVCVCTYTALSPDLCGRF